jgi:hypothetical protein
MRFKLEGVAYFEATDIDDAFARLGAHFTALAQGEDSGVLEMSSWIVIGPDKELEAAELS